MEKNEIWQDLLRKIENQISRHNFDIWFSRIQLIKFDKSNIYIRVPGRHFEDWIRDNYQSLIQTELYALTNKHYDLVFYTQDESSSRMIQTSRNTTEQESIEQEHGEKENVLRHFNLNREKTFSSFVVGSSNQFAHAAATAVAENPAQTYNPLFIFGPVGLGKTHLLNAIGNRMIEFDKKARVLYLSAEEFVNELINSIRDERMNEFRARFRDTCDALLVDDIQFLAGKIRTQEEFFYTFNALHSSGRQIVVTSDKFPKELVGMEERLRNRFSWGLIADIQPPDLETKVAILKKKAINEGINLPDDVALYIATNSQSNIRELEGILNRLVAASQLYKRAIDLEFTMSQVQQLLNKESLSVSIDTILETTARHFGIKISEIKGHRKQRKLVVPRQIAMYICRKHTPYSFPEIGEKFGGRDHSTVIYAVRKIESTIKKDTEMKNMILSLERQLGL